MDHEFWHRADWGILALLAVGTVVLTAGTYTAHVIACLAFLLAGLWLSSVAVRWSRQVKNWKTDNNIFKALLLLMAIFPGTGALLWFSWPANAQQQSVQPSINTPGNCNNSGTVYGNNQPNCGNTYNYAPPRQPNGLYQNEEKVGQAEGIQVNKENTQVTLVNPSISSSDVDLTEEYQLQGVTISCPDFKDNLSAVPPVGTSVNITLRGNIIFVQLLDSKNWSTEAPAYLWSVLVQRSTSRYVPAWSMKKY